MEAESGDIQTLGEPQVRILNTSNDVSVLEEELSSQPANKAPERVINAEIEKEMRDNFSFSTNMAYAPR